MSAENDDRKIPNIAVALRYEQGQGVPCVVAKGQGYVADRIVERAQNAGVPLHRDAATARSLAQLDIDQNIPPELYRAVAQVIGFLMRKGALR